MQRPGRLEGVHHLQPSEAEEMALSLQSMRPVAEGIPGGSSSDPPTPQDRSAFTV